MLKKKILLKLFILIFLVLGTSSFFEGKEVRAFSNQIIQKGAVGDDVIELQSRLQYIGFYNGKIDGVFGWSTYWALRNFQSEFGLPIDGLAGWPTKLKLAKASKYNEQFVKKQMNAGNDFTHYGGVDQSKQSTPNPANKAPKQKAPQNNTAPKKAAPKKPTAANTPNGFSQNDIQLMANAVYGESRGEPYTGQVAVASVILNRVNSSTFPNTVSGVIFEPGAFTAVADGQIWLTPNENAKKAVIDAINGWDPTGEALYYFNPDTATSGWIWGRPQIKRIGKHIFCK
ncbi:spore cortex-lytic enzyme [Neobacillus sp. OS1-33]|jgi:N-acetylmuramoyl-L-alanine amidase|uniref:spore cortex-lytic enzyme n=1 Tax=Neobacillus sp. OS1-33 TaxID=3070683 RepID=UPI0027DF72CA|nr:spore cortex-lytic enzyme [Neobacillus sp. OS1-33]WML25762.1 spore cortex-lytic enzyme [Neobacillus sp. OS1-33]